MTFLREQLLSSANGLNVTVTAIVTVFLLSPVFCFCRGESFQDETFAKLCITSNIVYHETMEAGKKTELTMDFYMPEDSSRKSRPLIVWIHGGGFFQGDKRDRAMSDCAASFARRGFACASLNYRLLLKNKDDWSDQVLLRKAVDMAVSDILAALDFFSRNRDRYQLDMSRVVLGGGSAGAITSLHAACQIVKRKETDYRIVAVIDFWGALFDLNLLVAGCPPILIIHGTTDRTVPYRFTETLVERACRQNVYCELHTLAGTGHAAWNDLELYKKWIGEFLGRHLR